MKKCFVFIAVVCVTLAASANDEKFLQALQSCSSFSDSGSVNTEGLDVVTQKNILGMESDRCVYQEKVRFSGINSCVTCRFTDSQINEIVSVMRAYNLVQRYSGESVDTSSLDSVKDNPVVRVWNKYLQDSSICTITAEQTNAQ